jgi:glycine/D-amino acid oxidase-like deaminating enzyme
VPVPARHVVSTAAELPERGVAVLGGGVLGVSTATQLAECGVAVTLITDGALASGASGRSLSWLNSAASRSPAYHRLRMIGIDRYRTLSAALDAPWLRFDGGLFWGERADAIAEHHREVGYEVRRVRAVAGIAVPAEGAYLNPGEGWVDLTFLVRHLAGRFTTAGGRLLTGVGAARPVVDGGRVRGARLADGTRVDADAVVVATGAAVPDMLGELGVPIHAQHSPAALVRTRPVDVGIRVVVNAPRVSLRPTPDGCLVVGAGWLDAELADDARTVPEERVPSCSPRRRRCSPAIPRSSRTPCTPGRARCRSTTSRCWAGSPDRGPARRVHPQRGDARPDRGASWSPTRSSRAGLTRSLDPFRPDRFAR